MKLSLPSPLLLCLLSTSLRSHSSSSPSSFFTVSSFSFSLAFSLAFSFAFSFFPACSLSYSFSIASSLSFSSFPACSLSYSFSFPNPFPTSVYNIL